MSEPMLCPACGVEMNFHAEKLVYSELDAKAHSRMGECIEEIHTCPRCGGTQTRPAPREM